MRNLTLTFFLAIVLHLVVGVDVVNALPKCTDPSYRHNCEDTVIFLNWTSYVGAFKDNKYHGQGTATSANGRIKEGIWEAGKFLYAQKAPASGKSIAEIAGKITSMDDECGFEENSATLTIRSDKLLINANDGFGSKRQIRGMVNGNKVLGEGNWSLPGELGWYEGTATFTGTPVFSLKT